MIDGSLTWEAVSQFLQTSSLVALALLLATGTLIPKIVVERYILAPRDARIDALERSMARRDEEYRKLVEQQAAALETQSRLLDRLMEELGKGGD